MYCKKCGNKLEKNTNFCSKCGSDVKPKEEKKEKSNIRKAILIIIGIIIVIVILVGVRHEINEKKRYNELMNPPYEEWLSGCYTERECKSASYARCSELNMQYITWGVDVNNPNCMRCSALCK